MPTDSPKARIAQRVVEVLDFFDEDHPQATVMDIVRRFDRPQSSTSDLLSIMVDLGLLYKDRNSRSYFPTARAAMLGNAVQPSIVRNGRLNAMLERLSAQTGLAVGLFARVGLETQIYNWRGGKRPIDQFHAVGLRSGLQDPLSDSAAGWLLLSTVDARTCDGVLRRLNAEASAERRFGFADMVARVEQCRLDRVATGPAGFATTAMMTAALLPGLPDDQPLVAGFVYSASDRVNPAALAECLTEAILNCLEEPASSSTVQPIHPPAYLQRIV